MPWPFKRKPEPPAKAATDGSAEDAFDRAARNLIAQGVPPHKVERATRLLKRYAQEGVLPDSIVSKDD